MLKVRSKILVFTNLILGFNSPLMCVNSIRSVICFAVVLRQQSREPATCRQCCSHRRGTSEEQPGPEEQTRASEERRKRYQGFLELDAT